jgi:hypothetical protein
MASPTRKPKQNSNTSVGCSDWRTVTFMASRQTNDAIQNTTPTAGHVPVEMDAQREQADGQRDQPTVCPKSVPVSVRTPEGRKDPLPVS